MSWPTSRGNAGECWIPVPLPPGIKITCADDAQCLAIFDPASDSTVLQKLLGKLPGIMPADVGAAKTCPIQPTTWTVEKVFAAVADEEHLRDVCIVFRGARRTKGANDESRWV